MYRKNYKKKKYTLWFKTNPTEHNINPKDRKFSAKKYKNFKIQKLKKKNKSTFYFNIGGNMSKSGKLRLDKFKNVLFSTKNLPSIQRQVKKKKFHPKVNKIYKYTPSKNILSLFSRKKTVSIYDYTDLVHYFDFSSINESEDTYVFDNVYVTHTYDGLKLYFCSFMGKIIFAESYDLLVKKICFRFFTKIEQNIEKIQKAIIEYQTNYNFEDLPVWFLTLYNKNLYRYFVHQSDADMKLPVFYENLNASPGDTVLVKELHALKTSNLDLKSSTVRDNLLYFITKTKTLLLQYEDIKSKNTFFCKQEIVDLVSNGFNIEDKYHISSIFNYNKICSWSKFWVEPEESKQLSTPEFNSYLFMSDRGDHDNSFHRFFKYWCKCVLITSNSYLIKDKIDFFSSIPVEFKNFKFSYSRDFYSIYREFLRLVKFVENVHKEDPSSETLKKLVHTCKNIQCLLEEYPYLLSSALENIHNKHKGM